MADPIIGATVQVVLDKLLSLTIEKARSIWNCENDLIMMKTKVHVIQAFIHDAEGRQVKEQAVEEWLKWLERVAEDAEYVFDEFTYESLEAQVMNNRTKPMEKVSYYLSHTAFENKMSGKIKKINKGLEDITQLATGLGLQSRPVPSQQIPPIRETDSVVVATDVVGRDNDVAKIKEKILNMREVVVPSTIPIVGMGGLGKTAVAKRIFNDEQITKHFEKRIWLCLPEMSHTSDTKIFLQQILESLTTEKNPGVHTRDIIVRKLGDELQKKRYLLVLDDLWCVGSQAWGEFKDSLRGVSTSRGSCILVTTRMKPVASTVAKAAGCHMLKKLTGDHCWSIFQKKAFADGDGEVPEEIPSMKNRIVEICRGLPLAASVLGGLLCNKEIHEWSGILDENPLVAGVDDNGENVLEKILKLSYDYLPSPHLKKCFAYFAMFPKDFKFEKDQLIQLWMAEGFLRPCPMTPVMEDVGNKFFQLLLQHSLLQDVEVDVHNNVTHCKMHDLVHDVAGGILKSKLFDQNSVGGENLSQIRYFGWGSPSDQIDKIYESGRLCTLFWKSSISEDMLLKFQFLRVLNLSGSGIEELSASINELIYLRYLDLSNTEIKDLPDNICKLYHLQTFKVKYCYSLRKLPEKMTNMISLRHLHWDYHYRSEIQLPLNMGQLTSLQTLPFFCLGSEKGRRIEELGRLKNLRGELTIKHLQLVKNKEEARTTYLREKSNIHKLVFLWSHDESEGCENNDKDVLDGLQPHPNLKALVVEDYLGTIFPSWFSEELLPKLVKLKLSGCKRCKKIPSLGQLKSLQTLELVGFHELECIGSDLYDIGSSSTIQVFPSLKELVLDDMPSLIEWKGAEVGVRMFPRLEKLQITCCPKLNSTPTQFEILRELEISRIDSKMPLLNLCSNLTSLVKLEVYFVGQLTCFPDEMLSKNVSLQHLTVTNCREFRELPQSLYNLHSLKSLQISHCDNFSSFPVPSGDNYLTSLQKLDLSRCDGLTSLPSGMLEHCRSLESLHILGCSKLISVPAGGLTWLQELRIGPSSEMVDFEAFELIFNGIQQLLSLRTLGVYGRWHWDSLPYQLMELSELTDITISVFGIEALPDRLGCLTSLRRLHLNSCIRLHYVDFSDVMPKLRDLWICYCPSLEALSDGLCNLVSLEWITLLGCDKLQHLPSRDAMRCLTKLYHLSIGGCPLLEESCTNQSDPNSQWFKISHIPYIEVDWRRIQDLPRLIGPRPS